MKKTGAVSILFLCLVSWLLWIPSLRADTDNLLTSSEKNLVRSTTDFGMKLFRELVSQADKDSNIFISPLSVSFALGMTYNGANSPTFDEMTSVLELSGLSLEEINTGYRHVIEYLIQLDPAVDINIANSIWYQDNLPMLQSFIDLTQTYYDAQVKEINFTTSREVDVINQWVSKNTRNRIKNVVDSPLAPNTVLMLVNAIYFKATWTFPFNTKMTIPDIFYLSDSSKSHCLMMSFQNKELQEKYKKVILSPDSVISYYENDLFQEASLPYDDYHFYMTVILPKPEYKVNDIISKLNKNNWEKWTDSLQPVKLNFKWPKLKLEYKQELKKALAALGMGSAFSPTSADFSKIVTSKAVWIDKVLHKTFLQVDEMGTEAAAVTSATIRVLAGPSQKEEVKVMIVNHPFIIIIHEKKSGAILFMGKIAKPNWQL